MKSKSDSDDNFEERIKDEYKEEVKEEGDDDSAASGVVQVKPARSTASPTRLATRARRNASGETLARDSIAG